MGYKDMEILKKREEVNKEKYNTLEDGIYQDGKIVIFERKKLLGQLSIFLPDSMKQMPAVYAKVKYPSEFRPQVIITTSDLSVNFGFTVFPNEISCNELVRISERMSAAIHRSNPDYRIYPSEKLQETKGCWFAFRSHAMDSDLYNMLLLISVGDKLVQCSFNCYYQEYQKWKKTVLMMWESIRAIGEEE